MPILRTLIALVCAAVALPLVLPFVLLILPLWVVSIVTRLGSRMLDRKHLTLLQLIEFDPHFGWKSRPNLDTYHLNVDLFQITTGADGWRGRTKLEESDVVVFGDSFAAGYGANDRQFFANLRRSPQIKAIGIGGYSLVQELLWMKRLAPSLHGKLVLWFVYYGNDLYDNLSPDMWGYRSPFLRETGRDGEWEFVTSHVSPEPWPVATTGRMRGGHYMPRLADLCSDTFLSARAYSACEFLLREGKEVCAEVDAEVVVISIPEVSQLSADGHRKLKALGGDAGSFDPDYPDRQLDAICGRLGLKFVPGRSFLVVGDYLADDCHWNARGHRKVADKIARLYDEHQARSQAELSAVVTPNVAPTAADAL